MTPLTPGIGFGAVLIGASRAAIEAALGAPASVHELDSLLLLNYPAIGVQVTLDVRRDAVETLDLHEASRFVHAYGAPELPPGAFRTFSGTTADGLGIGTAEADVTARLGAPTKTEKVGGGRWLMYSPLGIAFKVDGGVVCEISIDAPKAPKAKKDASGAGGVIARDLDWYCEQHENINSREFAKVWHAEGDLRLTAKEAAKLLGKADAALVVDGDLTIDGHLSIDDHHAVHVDGDLTCDSLWIAAGVLACAELTATRWFEFPLDDTQRMETLDISSLKAPIVACPSIDPDELASAVEYEFALTEVDDPGKLLRDHFDAVYAALKAGTEVDEDWAQAQRKAKRKAAKA